MRNPFKRQSSNQTIAELENYYGSSYNSGGSRTGKAWLMAILSLLITIAVIAALFFAIRWGYRMLTEDNESGDRQVQIEGDRQTGFEDARDGILGQGADPRSDEDTVVGVLNSDDKDQEEGVVSDEAASTTRNIAGESNNSSSTDLPNTGAGELLVAIPALTMVLGYSISRKIQLNK